jgi:hypothetical protein
VDPIGLVTVREQGYLLASKSGADRTTGCRALWPLRYTLDLFPWTHNIRCLAHSAHPAGPQPGVSGRKHRS